MTMPLSSLVQRDVEASTVASYPWRGRVWAPDYDALCTLLECTVSVMSTSGGAIRGDRNVMK